MLDRPSALDYSGYSNGSGTAAGPVGHSLDTYGDHVYAAGNADKFNTIRELFKTSPYVRNGEAVFVDGKSPGKLTNLTLSVPKMDGSKITVVEQDPSYGTRFHEFDTIEQAEAKATEIAHQRQADAYILKPVKKVSPKREVTVTDLP